MVDALWTLKKQLRKPEFEPVTRWAIVLVAFVFALPVISFFHELAVLGAALVLDVVALSPPAEWLIKIIVADQVYAGVALEMIGNTQARGLAISGPVGDALHALWPSFFLQEDQVVQGAWISAVLTNGSSVVSQFLVVVAADGLLILAGVLLVTIGLRGESLRRLVAKPARIEGPAVFGLLLQARSVFAILTCGFSQASLESSGLAQVGTKLLLTTRQSYESNVLPLSGWLALGLQILALLAVYAVALLVSRLVLKIPRLKESYLTWVNCPRPSTPARACKLAYLLPLVALSIFVSVSTTFGMVATNFGYGAVELETVGAAGEQTDAGHTSASTLLALVGPSTAQTPPRPKVVSITGGLHDYVYAVDGKRGLIRGVGYNVIYRQLPDEERALRYERDFAAMQRAGVNTILGWDADKGYEHDKFDELLLGMADRHGLGVLMPYYLPANGDYANPKYRADLQAAVLARVQRFKDYPAVRMWAIGNEVLHAMRPPGNPQAFADFYLELADAVHQADPNHPVIYRDAEDVYIDPLKNSWVKSKVNRPWLVYGTNIFTFRLNRVLDNWQRRGFDVPLLVTEFGPSGLSAADRPRGMIRMWRTIRNYPCGVLGGIIYAWSTAGPEPIDRVYGLVNEAGNPVDGTLEAIGTEFRQDPEPVGGCSLSPKKPR